MSPENLGRAMKRFYPAVTSTVTTRKRDGKQLRIFRGVRLITDVEGAELESDADNELQGAVADLQDDYGSNSVQ